MSSLGDVIHALPTLYAVRKNWPKAKITWAVHPQFASVLPGKPWIDELIIIDKKGLKSFSYLRSLWKNLHGRHFDMTLDLQCIAKSAIVSFCSGAAEKYGYWELREGSRLINKALVGPHKYDHVIERYLDTVRALGGQVDGVEFPLPEDAQEARVVQKELEILGMPNRELGASKYIVVAPGARWALKEWPISHFADLCQRLCQTGYYVVLAGAASDQAKSQAIVQAVTSKYLLDMTGKTSLSQLIELIRYSSLYISADTGPLHLANALKKPLIALFGTTSPDRTGPYGGGHVHIIVSPTSKATVREPLVNDPDCMGAIKVDSVWELCQSLLQDLEE